MGGRGGGKGKKTPAKRRRKTEKPDGITHPKPHRPSWRGSSEEPYFKSLSRTGSTPSPWKETGKPKRGSSLSSYKGNLAAGRRDGWRTAK